MTNKPTDSLGTVQRAALTLKTVDALRAVAALERAGLSPLSDYDAADICACLALIATAADIAAATVGQWRQSPDTLPRA